MTDNEHEPSPDLPLPATNLEPDRNSIAPLPPAGTPADDGQAVPVPGTAPLNEPSARAGLSAQNRLPRRRLRLPLVLFVLTCLSTFVAGATLWVPTVFLFGGSLTVPELGQLGIRWALVAHWQEGLLYMVCVLAILFAHEMGHFLATVLYRIPASFPFFLPVPFSPIGTFGAVIAMDGRKADRRQTFDIGIAGPLAGLVLALPIMWVGVQQLDFNQPTYGPFAVELPLLCKLMLNQVQPPGYQPGDVVWQGQFNPFFMAGWVGLLVTGLNMMPVSQLDGGHVIYTMFRKSSWWIARAFIVFVIAWMVYMETYTLAVMVGLVLLMRPEHPQTRDDAVPIGWFRYLLGCVSFAIPVLCFPPQIMILP